MEQNFHWIQRIQGIWKSLKHELGSVKRSCISHVSCWHCGSILFSHTRGGYVAGSSPFTVMTNIFATEFSKFSETFRKNFTYLEMNRVKNPSLFRYQCIFAMYRPRVIQHKQIIKPALKTGGYASWAIHSIASFSSTEREYFRDMIPSFLQGTDITVHKPYPFSSHTCAWQAGWRSPHYLPYINRMHYN